MKKYFYLFLFIFPMTAIAQQSLLEKEKSIKAVFDSIKDAQDDLVKAEMNQRLFLQLKSTLEDDSSFYYPFDSLKYLGKVYSDDKKLRIYTWNIQRNDNSFLFFGFVQFIGKNKLLIPLLQLDEHPILLPNKVIVGANWYGALYYKAIAIGSKKHPRYLLQGWRQQDIFSNNTKLIDVLSFQNDGLLFGENIFEFSKKDKRFRVVYNYCPTMQMNFRYEDKKNRFVFDHLSHVNSEDKQSCMGPDFSYDAFVKRGNKWCLKEDVDVRNEK